MIIEGIRLLNYRNYDELELKFHSNLNLFVGENAQGKTNLLEAIYICALGKSFRNNKDQELININRNQSLIKTFVKKSNRDIKIELILQKDQKKRIKVNDVSLNKYGELLGNLNVVLFSPEDLKIVKEGPSERRKFIDNDISQISPKYYYLMNQYNKILLQRNKLLKNKGVKPIDLQVWNEQLASYGTEIIIYRRNFIKKLSLLGKLMHRKITESKENLEIKYDSNIDTNENMKSIQIKEKFLAKIDSVYAEEKYRGISLCGPHRDDIKFTINGMDVKKFGSQGQQRTTVLSLKLSEIELIRGEVGEYPILLLDDVMSELDEFRQKYLLNNLKNIQTFITTTVINPFDLKNNNYKLHRIANGNVYNNK